MPYLQVQKLTNPTIDEFRKVLDSWQPNFVHIQGEILSNDEVGSVVWRGLRLSDVEAFSELFSSTMPTSVCHNLELLLFYSYLLLSCGNLFKSQITMLKICS